VNSRHLEDIIEGCKKGKRKSQEQLYKRFAGKMFAVCLYYSGNRTEAEDILHNGFIKVFESIKQYRGTGVFEAWMRKIFMHTALGKYRQKKQFVDLDEGFQNRPFVDVQEDALSQLSTQELIELIQDLSPAYRLVFNLYAVEGYSHKEIAKMLAISEGTSKSNLSRARSILQNKLNVALKPKAENQ
jgi:RNA polymerase sigma-70 factor (ECF subfamily)